MAYELMVQPIIFGGFAPDKIGGQLGNMSPDLKNIKFNLDGGIETVRGYVKFNAKQFKDGVVDGMYLDSLGELVVSVWSQNVLSGKGQTYRITSAGTVVGLSGTGGYTYDFRHNNTFISLNNIVMINTGNTPYYWRNVAGGDMVYQSTAPTMYNIIKHYSRLFGYAMGTIYWSNILDPLTWTTATDYLTIDVDSGHSLTGLASFLGDLYAFQKTRCDKIVGNDFDATSGNYSRIEMAQIPGCVNHKSIVVADGKLYWISTEGAIEFDGGSVPNKIGEGIIDNELRAKTVAATSTNYEPWIGVHYKSDNEIWWTYNDARETDGTTEIGTIYTYNYAMKKWSKRVCSNTPASMYRYIDPSTYQEKILMGGLISGYIHSWDGSATSADGSAIDSYYATDFMDLGKPLIKKNNYKLLLDMVRNASSMLSCSHYYDYDPLAVATGTINADDNEYNQFRDVYLDSLTVRTIKLKLAVNNAGRWFKINKATIQCYYDNGKI